MSEDSKLEQERRKKSRLTHRLRLKFKLQTGESFGFVINQSENGIFLQSRRLLRPKSIIIVWNDAGEVMAKGSVVWNKQEITGMGLETGGMGIHIKESFSNYDVLMSSLRSTLERSKMNSNPAAVQSPTNVSQIAPVSSVGTVHHLIEYERTKTQGLVSLTTPEGPVYIWMKDGSIHFIEANYLKKNFLAELEATGAIPFSRKAEFESAMNTERLVEMLVVNRILDYTQLSQKLKLFWMDELASLFLEPRVAINHRSSTPDQKPPLDLGIRIGVWEILADAAREQDVRLWKLISFQGEDLLQGAKTFSPHAPPKVQKLLRAAAAPIKLTDLLQALGGTFEYWANEILMCELYGLLKKL